eukprot:NODE_15706_length_1035_cov_3.625551.p1 GENE.NODE_15706_length_1035_cov_3.625551~~NODE_15706_length_1035_cov_3.625551.p1  ORF type:complete len:117 (+),score=24.44 NODE_15706_length_1035_cov_3.625551:92-442(+)
MPARTHASTAADVAVTTTDPDGMHAASGESREAPVADGVQLDSETSVPPEIFFEFWKAGRAAKQRGQHSVQTRKVDSTGHRKQHLVNNAARPKTPSCNPLADERCKLTVVACGGAC